MLAAQSMMRVLFFIYSYRFFIGFGFRKVLTRKPVLLLCLVKYGCACYIKTIGLLLFSLSFIFKINKSKNSPLGAFLVTDVIPV